MKTAPLFFLLTAACAGGPQLSGDGASSGDGETAEDVFLEQELDSLDDRREEEPWDVAEPDDAEAADAGEEEEPPGPAPPCEPPVVANVPRAGCGDGVAEEDEECDDGNLLDGDGCTWDCLLGDGTSGEAGPSPLPLPRYCRFEEAREIVGISDVRPRFPERTPPALFWKAGDGYRLLYSEKPDEETGCVRLLAFDASAAAVETLFEREIEDAGEGYDLMDFYPVPLRAVRAERIDVYLVRDEGSYPRTCCLARFSLTEDGEPLGGLEDIYGFHESRDDVTCASFDIMRVVRSRGRVAVTFGFQNEEVGLAFDEAEPSSACLFDIEPPLSYGAAPLARAALFFEQGERGYLLSSTASFEGYGDAARLGCLLSVPAGTHLPSDTDHRRICEAPSPGASCNHRMDLEASAGGFLAASMCFLDLEWRFENRHFLAFFSDSGDLERAPTRVFPEGTSFGGCLYEDIFLARGGDGTIGVLTACGRGLFQTLDMEGRQVGGPCEPPRSIFVIDLIWDGEGYAAACYGEDALYFWRALPDI